MSVILVKLNSYIGRDLTENCQGKLKNILFINREEHKCLSGRINIEIRSI